MTTVKVVNTSADLLKALQSAKGGDRIELAPGSYSGFTLKNVDYADTVTLTSQDPENRAVITGMVKLQGVGGLTIEGVDMLPPAPLPDHNNIVTIQGSHDIALVDMTVRGTLPSPDPVTGKAYPNFKGVMIQDSRDVALDGLDISQVQVGVFLNRTEGVSVRHSELHHIRTDGINFVESRDVVIENNYFHAPQPKHGANGSADHPDFIQWWGVANGKGIHNVAIRDNVMLQGEGDFTQGIFGHAALKNTNIGGFTNFEVTGNFLQISHANGIVLGDVVGGVIADNVLIPSGHTHVHNTTDGRPYINLASVGYSAAGHDGVSGAVPSDIEVRDNLYTYYAKVPMAFRLPTAEWAAQGVTVDGNAALEASGRKVPAFWGTLELPPVDPTQPLADWIAAATAQVIATAQVEGTLNTQTAGDHDMDLLSGTEADDMLTARGGDDWIAAGAGDDRLDGGAGSDVLVGGIGADTFVMDRRTASTGDIDRVFDLDFAEGDLLSLARFEAGRFAVYGVTANGPGTGILIDSLADLYRLDRAGAVEFTAIDDDRYRLSVDDAGAEVVIELTLADNAGPGAAGLDGEALVVAAAARAPQAMVAGGSADLGVAGVAGRAAGLDTREPGLTLTGDGGADVLAGGAGADVLFARGGADWLIGGDGADRLTGGKGSDVLVGGGGNDTFVFQADEFRVGEIDRIADLDFAGGDRIDLVRFAPGTFSDAADPGNRLQVLDRGTAVRIDSLDDLAELAGAPDVTITRSGLAQLTLTHTRGDVTGSLELNLAGLGEGALDAF